jgi:hypothetical protein
MAAVERRLAFDERRIRRLSRGTGLVIRFHLDSITFGDGDGDFLHG